MVSIGVPVYNGEKYICRALDSLLAQEYQNIGLIISDNCSTDNTFEICKGYAKQYPQIHLYRTETNIGAIANFRLVLEKAQGKYFFWAAADDYWHPEFISVLIKELETYPEAGVAMCAFDRVWENGALFNTIRFIDKDNPNHRSYYQMLKSITSRGKKYNLKNGLC